VSFWSKLLLVPLYFYISVYIFTTSLISFVVREPAKGLFKGSRDSRRLLALALYSPVLAEAVTDSKGVVNSKRI
jgi:hypothetical protein